MKVSLLFIPLILLVNFAYANAEKFDFFYHVTFRSEKVQPEELTKLLLKLGAQKAAQKELGELERGTPYYHFIISNTHLTELWAFLLKNGQLNFERAYSQRMMPTGSARIVMWLDRQAPEKEKRIHMLQSLAEPKSPYGMTLNLDAKKFSDFILERVVDGPLQVQDILPQKDQEINNYYFRNTQGEIIKKSPTRNDVDLEIQLSSIVKVSPEQFKQLMKTKFSELSWSVTEHAFDWFFQGMVPADKLPKLLTTLMSISPLNFSSSKEQLSNKENVLVEIRVQKSDLVSETYSKAKNSFDEVEQEKQVVLKEKQGPRRTYRKGGEIHVFGSAVPAPEEIIIIGDAYAQLWVENWGARFHNIQSKSDSRDYKFNSSEFSMQYRFPLKKYTFGQSIVTSLIYKKIISDGPIGYFEGFGISYIDDIWEDVDKFFNLIPFLRYTKTVEVNGEYLPFSTTSNVSNIKAYVFTLKMYMFITKKFTIEGGFYHHYFHFLQNNSGTLNSNISFAEIGVGYRF